MAEYNEAAGATIAGLFWNSPVVGQMAKPYNKGHTMGTWGSLPWDNDTAADWFGEMFEQTKLVERVERTLKLSAAKHYDQIRAAASLVLLLGHTYVWPSGCLRRHQRLAAKRLEELLKKKIFCGDFETTRMVRSEMAYLRAQASRRAPEQLGEGIQTRWLDEFFKLSSSEDRSYFPLNDMNANKLEAQIKKKDEIHAAIEGALKSIDENAGKDGYRMPYDKAIHIIAALKNAGYDIVRKPRTPQKKELLSK